MPNNSTNAIIIIQSLTDGEGKSISIGKSQQNRKKNCFGNISACKNTSATSLKYTHTTYFGVLCIDDNNRVILNALEGYRNDYINASYMDVSTESEKYRF